MKPFELPPENGTFSKEAYVNKRSLSMPKTPGQRAKALVETATIHFYRGKISAARQTLQKAFELKLEVEQYAGPEWVANHHDFTRAMLDMAVLRYKLGQFSEGDALASLAQARADDPMCSSQNNFERSRSVQKGRVRHFLAGLPGWCRAAIPI